MSSQKTLVSVIICCHNYARYLAGAIESVLNQTYTCFEIVAVDDGSTDYTAEVIARYPRAHYIHQKNQGVSAARNTGLRESRGAYIVFLDADDLLLRTALEIAVKSLDAHPECAFVSGHCQVIAHDGSPMATAQLPQYVEKDHYLALLRGNFIWNLGVAIYRREALEFANGFDVSLRAAEDYDLSLRITRQFPIHCHGKLVLKYRKHGAGLSSKPEKMLESLLHVLRAQYPYTKGNEEYEEAYKAGIKGWQAFYGYRVVKKAYACLRRHGDWKQALKLSFVLMRYYRHGLRLLGLLVATNFCGRSKRKLGSLQASLAKKAPALVNGPDSRAS